MERETKDILIKKLKYINLSFKQDLRQAQEKFDAEVTEAMKIVEGIEIVNGSHSSSLTVSNNFLNGSGPSRGGDNVKSKRSIDVGCWADTVDLSIPKKKKVDAPVVDDFRITIVELSPKDKLEIVASKNIAAMQKIGRYRENIRVVVDRSGDVALINLVSISTRDMYRKKYSKDYADFMSALLLVPVQGKHLKYIFDSDGETITNTWSNMSLKDFKAALGQKKTVYLQFQAENEAPESDHESSVASSNRSVSSFPSSSVEYVANTPANTGSGGKEILERFSTRLGAKQDLVTMNSSAQESISLETDEK